MTETTLQIPVQKAEKSRISEIDFNNIEFGKNYSDHMFVADYKDGEWQDLRIMPFADMQMSPATSALHYGQSIFEGLKAYPSESEDKVLIFRPDENCKRFNKSAIRMCMPEIPEEIFMEGLFKVIDIDRSWVPSQEGCSLYIRPFMFATDEYVGLKPSETYRFIIFTSPVGSYYSEPVKVKIETHYTRAVSGGTGAAKTAGNYAASLYPAKLAQEQGYHQLVWTDGKEHKYIEEAGTMNIMFVIGNKLRTAPLSDTILPGITRASVLQMARDWGLDVQEKPVAITEVIDAIKNGELKEAFGVGTAATIAQLALIGYEGVDYDLPKIETREFSNKVFKELEDLKRGRKEDNREWIFKV
ncbi:MAG: branched-chain amino acid aminotransferase [Bacteroidia bacterium]|jgi:branched-chain amino acid aminotransferase